MVAVLAITSGFQKSRVFEEFFLVINITLFDLQIKFLLPDSDFVFQWKEGGVAKGLNSQHDGGTEGRTRRRVALMMGGTMTALGNTARGSTAGQLWQGAARRRAARRRQRQRGVAWQDNKGKGWHGSEGQDS